MATKSPFDPDKTDSDFYSKDPNQHGNSDYGRESGGVGTNEMTTTGMDMDSENRNITHDTREANQEKGRFETPTNESTGTSQEWDVDADAISDKPKGRMMSDEAAKKLGEIAENPSDDALLHRADATYLEEGDDPNKGYDPHSVGYSGTDKESVEKKDMDE